MTVPSTRPPGPVDDDGTAAVLTATRTWRRIGVRSGDVARLRRELAEDLGDAAADGVTVGEVLGEDTAVAARTIAIEQELHGLAARYGICGMACLAAALLSWAPVILLLAAEFSNGSGTAWDSPYLYYGTAGILSYFLIPFAAEYALLTVGDRRARRTRTVLFKSLPLVALATTAAGCLTAAAQGFETRPAVFISVSIVVTATFIVGCLASRAIVLLNPPRPDTDGSLGLSRA